MFIIIIVLVIAILAIYFQKDSSSHSQQEISNFPPDCLDNYSITESLKPVSCIKTSNGYEVRVSRGGDTDALYGLNLVLTSSATNEKKILQLLSPMIDARIVNSFREETYSIDTDKLFDKFTVSGILVAGDGNPSGATCPENREPVSCN